MRVYQIKRKYRKSLKLLITPRMEIIVEAPMNMSKEDIDQFVEKYDAWIEQHLTLLCQQNLQVCKHLNTIPFIGKDYKVNNWEQKEICLNDDGIFIPKEVDPLIERKKIVKWYRQQAQVLLEKRIQYWAKKMNCQYARLNISSAKKRWGSCTNQGNISFSWRLMQAPPQAIDYVIIHELTHLHILNHSTSFWQLVSIYCPNYKEQKEVLKQTAEKAYREGWNLL